MVYPYCKDFGYQPASVCGYVCGGVASGWCPQWTPCSSEIRLCKQDFLCPLVRLTLAGEKHFRQDGTEIRYSYHHVVISY